MTPGSRKTKDRAGFRDRLMGKRMRERRLMLGLTLSEVGARLGIAQQQVQKYETGFNKFSASRLIDVSEALGVPVEYFYVPFMVTRGGTRRQDSADKASVRESVRLVRNYWRIEDEASRRAILDIVRRMALQSGSAQETRGQIS